MLQSKVGSSAEYKDKVESANPKAVNVTEQQSGESLQSIKPGWADIRSCELRRNPRM